MLAPPPTSMKTLPLTGRIRMSLDWVGRCASMFACPANVASATAATSGRAKPGRFIGIPFGSISTRPGTCPELLLKFRVHRFLTARRQVGRYAVSRADVLQERVLVQLEMRHLSLLESLVDRGAKMRGNLSVDRQTVLRAANQWLRQIAGIVHDVDPGEVIAPPSPPRRDRRFIGHHGAVSTNVVFFQMRGFDPEHIAFPRRRRISAPDVRGLVGRALTAVEKHRTVGRLMPFRLIGDQLARERI